MGAWEVKRDEDRVQWVFTPLVGVGPLRFGMTPHDVAAALAPALETVSVRTSREGQDPRLSSSEFADVGVTTYYGNSERLAGVAADALIGPQVTMDGKPLVGRTPSAMGDWIAGHTEVRGFDLLYSHEGDPASADLGLIMRAQRAGDLVLTRPLFVLREWAMNAWDHVPSEEWQTF